MAITKIEELWSKLEAARATANEKRRTAGGWILRQVRPDATCPLSLGVELATGRRGLLLAVPRLLIPPKRIWPTSRSLEMVVTSGGADVLFGVVLREPRHVDLFSALAEDLARRITREEKAPGRVASLLGGLARWQKFLSVRMDGLSEETQRGLWGELYFLRVELLPVLGEDKSIIAWQGPSGAAQDFQLSIGAFEVKTTLAKPPHVITVASERQLDYRGLPALFIRHYAIAANAGSKETLPRAVELTRAALSASGSALEVFEDKLLSLGYLDFHAPRYEERGYRIREMNYFEVRSGFPCITESDLPDGVGNVRYSLALDACKQFHLPSGEVALVLATSK